MRTALIAITIMLAGCSGIPDDPLYWSMQASKIADGCTTLNAANNPSLR